MADEPDPREPAPLELDVAPTIPGRIARWTATGARPPLTVEAARRRHRSLDLAFDVVERDSTIGGGMLGGALAYRLFVFLLPLVALPRRRSRDLRRHHGAEPFRGRLQVGTDRADRQGGLSGRVQPVALGDLHRDLPRPRLRRRDALPGDRDRACDRLARLRPCRPALVEGIRCLQRRLRRAVRRPRDPRLDPPQRPGQRRYRRSSCTGFCSAVPGSHSPGIFPAATSAGRHSCPEPHCSLSGWCSSTHSTCM